MAFVAETLSGQLVDLDENNRLHDKKSRKLIPFESLYKCPDCGCDMTVRALSSNKKRAYFGGSHKDGCSIGEAHKSTGHTSYKPFSNKEGLKNIYRKIRKAKTNFSKNKIPTRKLKGTGKHSSIKRAGSLRTIVKSLENLVPGDIVSDDGELKLEDVIVDERTLGFYPDGISGLRIVCAEFKRYNKKTFIFEFHCPTVDSMCFQIEAHVKNKIAWDSFRQVYRHQRRKVIICAIFRKNRCTIWSVNQVVPVKNF